MELPQCLDRKVKRQRMGRQAPFETGDYNGVSEELQNSHGPNANRNSAKSAVLQVRRVYRQYPAVWSVKGMTL